MLVRVLAATVRLAPAMSSVGVALTARVAICGRVASFDSTALGGPLVRLGTREPRHLVGGSVPQVGSEVCIWGVAVENFNPPMPDPTPKGIAAVGSVACAVVTGTTAIFLMPGEGGSALPNAAALSLSHSTPPDDGCVRIAVDAQGNPVAVVVPRGGTTSPVASPSTGVVSLPNTSTSDDR